MRRTLFASALTALLVTAAGCGAPEALEDAEAQALGQSDSALTASRGISVHATYSTVVVGTPTYGSDGTQTVLNVKVEVDDAALRQQFPGFDGMERAFVLVPVRRNGSLAWDTKSLSWTGTRRTGYYGNVVLDIHESGAITGVDATTLQTYGVAVGLNTNLGTVWAQQPGNNWPVTRK